MGSTTPLTTGRPDRVDVLHLLFGGLGGQLGVARGIAAAMVNADIRSAAISYTPPGEHLRDAATWAEFQDVRFIDKCSRFDLAGARAIGRAIREIRPRAVLLHSPYAPLATLRAKASRALGVAVLIEHTPLAVRTMGDDIRSLLALVSARGIVLLTPDYGERLRIGPVLRRSGARIRVIPNGIDVQKFSPGQRAASGSPQVVGMAARLNPLKDTATLISAVAELRHRGVEVQLRIAGDGPSREALIQASGEMGLSDIVRFEGKLDESDVAEWMRGLAVYVHASHGETMSTSVLQALATGLPCVLSDAPGLVGFASSERGEGALLATPSDPIAMADAIAELLDDTGRRRSMGERNRTRCVEEHSLEAMGRNYLSLLADIDPAGGWGEALERMAAAP